MTECEWRTVKTLQWRHVRVTDSTVCSTICLVWQRRNQDSLLLVLCNENPSISGLPSQRASNAEGVSMSWRSRAVQVVHNNVSMIGSNLIHRYFLRSCGISQSCHEVACDIFFDRLSIQDVRKSEAYDDIDPHRTIRNAWLDHPTPTLVGII